jgi:hypothetical protein
VCSCAQHSLSNNPFLIGKLRHWGVPLAASLFPRVVVTWKRPSNLLLKYIQSKYLERSLAEKLNPLVKLTKRQKTRRKLLKVCFPAFFPFIFDLNWRRLWIKREKRFHKIMQFQGRFKDSWRSLRVTRFINIFFTGFVRRCCAMNFVR